MRPHHQDLKLPCSNDDCRYLARWPLSIIHRFQSITWKILPTDLGAWYLPISEKVGVIYDSLVVALFGEQNIMRLAKQRNNGIQFCDWSILTIQWYNENYLKHYNTTRYHSQPNIAYTAVNFSVTLTSLLAYDWIPTAMNMSHFWH